MRLQAQCCRAGGGMRRVVKLGSGDGSGGRGFGTGLGARRPLASLGGGWGTLTLVPQVGVGHELVNHQVHLPQLPRAEVLPASFVLQEDCGWEETGSSRSPLPLATRHSDSPSHTKDQPCP